MTSVRCEILVMCSVRFRGPAWALSVLLAIAASGCGSSGPDRIPVAGKVNYQGKPVPAGQLQFDPDTAHGNDGPQGFAHIKQGHYDTRDQGRAPVAGPQHVRIIGLDGVPAPEMPQGHVIFRAWTTDIDIDRAKTEYDFDVPAGGGKK
jgi:hypothetical protein